MNKEVYRTELLRLNPDGTPDSSFGNSSTPGLLTTNLDATADPVPSAAIQATTGDILVIGDATIPSPTLPTHGVAVDAVLPAATAATAASPTPTVPADILGSGSTNSVVYDPTTGAFTFYGPDSYVNGGIPETSLFFGVAGAGQTIPAAADYQGLGFDQVAAYLSTSGVYAIYPTATSPGLFQQFGIAGLGQSIPVPADYYGDRQGRRRGLHAGDRHLRHHGHRQSARPRDPLRDCWGRPVDPDAGDYYHTGQDDIAVYLAQYGAFAILAPGGQTGEVIPFGIPGLGKTLPGPGRL